MKNLALSTLKQLTVALAFGIVIIFGITTLYPKNVFAKDGSNHIEKSINCADDNTYTMLLQIDGIIDQPYRIKMYHRDGAAGRCEFIVPLDTHIAMKLRMAEMKGETINGVMEMTSDVSDRWMYILCFRNAHINRISSGYEERPSGAVDIYDRIIITGELFERYVY